MKHILLYKGLRFALLLPCLLLNCAPGVVVATLRGTALIAQINHNFYHLYSVISEEGQTTSKHYVLCVIAYNDAALDRYAKSGLLDCQGSLSGDYVRVEVKFVSFQDLANTNVFKIVDDNGPTNQLKIGVSLSLGSDTAGLKTTFQKEATDGQVIFNTINFNEDKSVNYVDLILRTKFYEGTTEQGSLDGTISGSM